jgi:uncharacterized membrane protein
MAGGFHESYAVEAVAPPTPRSTGLVFAGATLIGAVLLRNSTPVVPAGLAAASIGFLLTSLMAPALLGPLNAAWFRLALLLNRIVSPVVMLLLFLVAIVPFGLVMQLKRDPLRKRRSAGSGSYWIARDRATAPSCMRNQF